MTAIRQNIGRVGLRLRNEWTATPQEPYMKMDVVSKDGSSYTSLIDNNTTTPPSESWQIQSQRGEVGHGVKEGGSAGQVLTKKSGTDYDTEWQTKPTGIPNGGTTGQIIKKQSGKGLAIAGLVCGIVGTVVCGIITICNGALFS